jgi:hypothetical protein
MEIQRWICFEIYKYLYISLNIWLLPSFKYKNGIEIDIDKNEYGNNDFIVLVVVAKKTFYNF